MSDTTSDTTDNTLFFNRNNEESIEVTESLQDIAHQATIPGEFFLVTDPEDGPFMLRRDMVDLVVPKATQDAAEAREQEDEEAA